MSSRSLSGILFIAAALALSAGCAVEHKKGLEDMRLTPELVDKVQKEGEVKLTGVDQVICRLEMPTGSHRAIWRCDTLEGYQTRANKNQFEMQKAQAAPKPKIGG